jgi:hypothetical protein
LVIPGDPGRPPGALAVAHAQELRAQLQALLGLLRRDAVLTAKLGQLLEQARVHEIHTRLTDAHGRPFPTFEAFALHPTPWGLGYRPEAIEAILAERSDIRAAARAARPLHRHGEQGPYRDARREARRDDGKTTTAVTGSGQLRGYLLARLARDRPDLLARIAAGEIRSAQAAARLAGWATRFITCRQTAQSFAAQALKYLPAEEVARLIAYLQEPGLLPEARRSARSDALARRRAEESPEERARREARSAQLAAAERARDAQRHRALRAQARAVRLSDPARRGKLPGPPPRAA